MANDTKFKPGNRHCVGHLFFTCSLQGTCWGVAFDRRRMLLLGRPKGPFSRSNFEVVSGSIMSSRVAVWDSEIRIIWKSLR